MQHRAHGAACGLGVAVLHSLATAGRAKRKPGARRLGAPLCRPKRRACVARLRQPHARRAHGGDEVGRVRRACVGDDLAHQQRCALRRVQRPFNLAPPQARHEIIKQHRRLGAIALGVRHGGGERPGRRPRFAPIRWRRSPAVALASPGAAPGAPAQRPRSRGRGGLAWRSARGPGSALQRQRPAAMAQKSGFERFGSFRQQLEKAAERARETVTTMAKELEQTVCVPLPKRPRSSAAAEPARLRRRLSQTRRSRPRLRAAPAVVLSSQRCVRAAGCAKLVCGWPILPLTPRAAGVHPAADIEC